MVPFFEFVNRLFFFIKTPYVMCTISYIMIYRFLAFSRESGGTENVPSTRRIPSLLFNHITLIADLIITRDLSYVISILKMKYNFNIMITVKGDARRSDFVFVISMASC